MYFGSHRVQVAPSPFPLQGACAVGAGPGLGSPEQLSHDRSQLFATQLPQPSPSARLVQTPRQLLLMHAELAPRHLLHVSVNFSLFRTHLATQSSVFHAKLQLKQFFVVHPPTPDRLEKCCMLALWIAASAEFVQAPPALLPSGQLQAATTTRASRQCARAPIADRTGRNQAMFDSLRPTDSCFLQ